MMLYSLLSKRTELVCNPVLGAAMAVTENSFMPEIKPIERKDVQPSVASDHVETSKWQEAAADAWSRRDDVGLAMKMQRIESTFNTEFKGMDINKDGLIDFWEVVHRRNMPGVSARTLEMTDILQRDYYGILNMHDLADDWKPKGISKSDVKIAAGMMDPVMRDNLVNKELIGNRLCFGLFGAEVGVIAGQLTAYAVGTKFVAGAMIAGALVGAYLGNKASSQFYAKRYLAELKNRRNGLAAVLSDLHCEGKQPAEQSLLDNLTGH